MAAVTHTDGAWQLESRALQVTIEEESAWLSVRDKRTETLFGWATSAKLCGWFLCSLAGGAVAAKLGVRWVYFCAAAVFIALVTTLSARRKRPTAPGNAGPSEPPPWSSGGPWVVMRECRPRKPTAVAFAVSLPLHWRTAVEATGPSAISSSTPSRSRSRNPADRASLYRLLLPSRQSGTWPSADTSLPRGSAPRTREPVPRPGTR